MRMGVLIFSSGRHLAMAAAEAALVTAIAVALLFAGAVVTGGAPGGADQVAAKTRLGSAGSTISLNQDPSTLHLGSSVTFTSNAVGLLGGEYPLILVTCSQGGDAVYKQLALPTATFVLGGGSSPWWVVGGSASCNAELYAYGGKSRGYDTIRLLAQLPAPFTAGG